MRIAIDNLDGRGELDYSAQIASEGPLTIERALNAPSRCSAEILLATGGLPIPARLARVMVTAESGETLFTGYVTTEPVRVYAGEASEGPVYRARMTAVSDEWLLDKAGSGAGPGNEMALGMTAQSLLNQLSSRVGGPAQPVNVSGVQYATGVVAVRADARWATNAGAAAGAAYAAYRAVGGTVNVQTAGTATHRFNDADGSLQVSALAVGHVRELANDVTVSGEQEPTAYVSECFTGDGTTTAFELSDAAFRGAHRRLVRDSFSGASIDATQWTVSDPGSKLALTSAGLTVNGGTGTDGVTTLTAIDAIEMGGSVVAELSSVSFGAGSDGMLGGFYNGLLELSTCMAGFRVRQSVAGGGGVTVVVPVVNGAEVGTVFTPVSGHLYTLRLRLHCVEMQRVLQRYYAMVDGAIQGFGQTGGVAAPMDVVFELVDQGNASSTPATVLYDSFAAGAPLASTPAVCQFAAVNSTELFASVGAVAVKRPGSAWITSIPPTGGQLTRLIGLAGQGSDCEVSYGTSAGAKGKVTFFAGRVPVANELVTVHYRTERRAVARLENAASVSQETAGGKQGTSRWLGKVLQPSARSSADCESAAQAVLAFASSRSAAQAGTYKTLNPETDIWPGDVLSVTSAGASSSFLVRKVEIIDGASVPETREYRLTFANDWASEWADGLGVKLSEAIAADAWLPLTASSGPPAVLANLQQLTVTSVSTSEVGVDMGTDPPTGGGFEVRRKDWNFGDGTDAADLVLRSPVRSFSIPRAAQVESFYFRMYDGSTPAVYSRWSSVAIVHAPVS